MNNKYGGSQNLPERTCAGEDLPQYNSSLSNESIIQRKNSTSFGFQDNLEGHLNIVDESKIMITNDNEDMTVTDNINPQSEFKCDISANSKNNLKGENSNFNSQCNQSEKVDKTLQQKYLQLEIENKYLKMNRNKCENCFELTKEFENKKIINNEISNNYQLEIKNLCKSIEELRLKLKQLKNKCEYLQDKNKAIRNNHDEEMKILSFEYNKLCSQLRNHEDKFKNDKLKRLEKENAILKKKYSQQEQEKENLKLKCNLFDKINEYLKDNYHEFKPKLNQSDVLISQNKYSQSEGNNEYLKSKCAQSDQIKENLQNNYDELKLDQSDESNGILQQICSQSEKNNKNLIRECDLSDQINENLQNNYNECKLKLDQSNEAKDILQQKYSQPQEEHENLKSKCIQSDQINENEQSKKEKQTENQNDTHENQRTDQIPEQIIENPKASDLQIVHQCFIIGEDTRQDENSQTISSLFDLISALRKSDSNNINEALDVIQHYNTESSFGDDVYKCFMNLLSRVSKVVKTNIKRPEKSISHHVTVTGKAQENFEKYKNRNPGFVFDNFYGQLTFQFVCENCNEICNQSFQVLKSLPLPVPKCSFTVTLESCVDSFFGDSQVTIDTPLKCLCGSINMISRIKLTHGPKYLFIYLNRGSYIEHGEKIGTFVTCNENTINIKDSRNNLIHYKLISVIDHIGDKFGGHYYCKCSFERNQWWLLNDSQVEQHSGAVVTKNTIVFLFKQC